jgi:glycine/sarcosine N-methyltransferase
VVSLAASIRRRWLTAVASRPAVRNLLLPFIPAAVFRIGLIPLQGSPFPSFINQSGLSELALDLVFVFSGWLVVQFSRTWGVREMMASVYDIASATQNPNRAFLRNYASSQIQGVARVVRQLSQGTYRADEPGDLARWFDALFDDGGAWYCGIDSHLPSEYMNEFGWYLDTHARALDRRDGHSRRSDVRVITTLRDDLTHNYARFTGIYGSFYDWHKRQDVDARWLSLRDTEVLRERYKIGTADVGLWEKHAVLFTPEEGSDAITFSIYYPGEGTHDGISYEIISSYVDEVLEKSEDLGDVAPRLELIDPDLAESWETYLDPASREEGPLGKFLLDVLQGKQYVLDAAAGIASDSVFLLEQGFSVWSNEVDRRLAETAEAYATRRRAPLKLTSYLWETLPDSLEGGMRFEAVLVLGNSICLVQDDAQRRQCLNAFHDVLRPGGALVLDERNFSYMLDYSKEIVADPAKYFPPTLAGDVMYGGRKVRGFPAQISKEDVVWRFFDNASLGRRGARRDILDRLFQVNDLHLYPFAHGELYGLLKETGFVNIRVFADLQMIGTARGTMPSREAIGSADFITYVAERPQDGARGARMAGAHRQSPGA